MRTMTRRISTPCTRPSLYPTTMGASSTCPSSSLARVVERRTNTGMVSPVVMVPSKSNRASVFGRGSGSAGTAIRASRGACNGRWQDMCMTPPSSFTTLKPDLE